MRCSTGSPSRAGSGSCSSRGRPRSRRGFAPLASRWTWTHSSTRRDGTIWPSGLPSSAGWTNTPTPRRPCCRCTRPPTGTERWPNELDLHDRFPGFFADAQDVFERLWERRKTVNVAAHDIACPDPAGQALVLALHTLRDPHDPSKAHELSSLVERVSATATADSLRDLAELARDLGAADTAAPFLDRVGAPAVGRGSTDPADLRAWSCAPSPTPRPASPGSTSSGSSRGDDAPATSGTPRSSVTSSCGWRSRTCPLAARPLLHARIRRLRRGLRALPAAARSVRRIERER